MAGGKGQDSEGREQEEDTAMEEAVVEEDEAEELLCEPCEERVPKTLLPTAKEVAAHNITHCPYRSW